MTTSRSLPALLLALSAFGATGTVAATELAGLRFVPDPTLALAGHPLRIGVDFSLTGDSAWCRWTRDEHSGTPAVELDHGTVVLWATRVDPAPPCIEEAPRTLDFDLPSEKVTEGLLSIELRRRTGFLQQEVLGRFGVDVQPLSESLRLQRERFLLEIEFRDPRDGQLYAAHALRSSDESGTFWFFDPGNPEVMVKLLDGSGVNGHFWLYASSLTTLEFTLRITDTAGGCLNLPVVPAACPTREYHQAEGIGHNLEDVEAMPSPLPGPEPPAIPAYSILIAPDPALPRRGEPLRIVSNWGADPGWCYMSQGGSAIDGGVLYLLVQDHSLPILPPPCPAPPAGLTNYVWEIDTSAPELADQSYWEVRLVYEGEPLDRQPPVATTGFDLCAGMAPSPYGPGDLLLHQGGFLARIDWSNPATGEHGAAAATQLSDDSGQFTFFDPGNVEVTVKLLDGRPVNGYWWLFVGTETRLPYRLTIVRDAWGCGSLPTPPPECEVYTFDHPEGPPQNRVDIAAFAGEGP